MHCWGLDHIGQTTVLLLDFDKDRDGLSDSIENDTGFFVSSSETGQAR